jgi:hypothetical protein
MDPSISAQAMAAATLRLLAHRSSRSTRTLRRRAVSGVCGCASARRRGQVEALDVIGHRTFPGREIAPGNQ